LLLDSDADGILRPGRFRGPPPPPRARDDQ